MKIQQTAARSSRTKFSHYIFSAAILCITIGMYLSHGLAGALTIFGTIFGY